MFTLSGEIQFPLDHLSLDFQLGQEKVFKHKKVPTLTLNTQHSANSHRNPLVSVKVV